MSPDAEGLIHFFLFYQTRDDGIVIETLEILQELQEVDRRIDALYADGGNLPEEIQSLKVEWQQKKDAFLGKKEQFANLEAEQRRLEREIISTQEAIQRFDKQLSLARNNKEYRVLEQQINDKEYLVLELDEELSNTKDKALILLKEIEDETPIIEHAETEFQEKLSELERRLNALEGDLEVVQDERLRVTTRLKKPVLRTYERLRKGFSNVVVPIRRDACSGCNMKIPPQIINEAKRQNEIIFCNNCGRIIFWDGDL